MDKEQSVTVNIEQEVEQLHAVYAKKFGEVPSSQWIQHVNGDGRAYVKLIKKAISSGVALGDYSKANGYPKDADI